MLKELDRLSGTLNSTKPAMEMGILFKEPTRLYYRKHNIRWEGHLQLKNVIINGKAQNMVIEKIVEKLVFVNQGRF